MSREEYEFWALMWREKDDWGWLCSLDGDRECTTTDAAKRLRYYSRERALSALWRFRADNPKRPGEVVRVVHVRVVTKHNAKAADPKAGGGR